MNAANIRDSLNALADPTRPAHHQRFFRTGLGDYGEGDIFLGLTSPQVRAAAKEGRSLSLVEVERLLEDPTHEIRACGLVILVEQFKKADETTRASIIELYLRCTDRINNWDLVGISCGILGQWLMDKNRNVLDRLFASSNIWEQRIAVVSTLPLIKSGDFTDILRLVERLKTHPHDLMHKAMGWMLREVGKKTPQRWRHFCKRMCAPCSAPRCAMLLNAFQKPSVKRGYDAEI